MNSKLKLALFLCVLVFFTVNGEMMEANAAPRRVAQGQSKSSPSKTNDKTASPPDCSLLTPAMIEKVLGQGVRVTDTHKAMPMYGGAWGWSCEYRGEGVHVDFVVYEEATSAKAKDDFDKLSIGADESAGKPSIGESAFWNNTDSTHPYLYVLKDKVYFLVSMSGTKRGDEKQMRQTKNLAAAVAAH